MVLASTEKTGRYDKNVSHLTVAIFVVSSVDFWLIFFLAMQTSYHFNLSLLLVANETKFM